MPTTPYVLDKTAAEQLLAQVDVHQAMVAMFRELAAGHAVQPAQQLVEFPSGAGDFINYLGVLAGAGVYGVKTSPYIVREQGPLITAWTLLMSMQSGQPLLLCDAGSLTTARTAATTAVAVDALAAPKASHLAVIGSGAVAQAHVHYAKHLRPWQSIRLYSPGLAGKTGAQLLQLQQLDLRVQLCASQTEALRDADVVMLCTSSAKPLLDPTELDKPALITSISTNAPRAHEVTPASLLNMDVYCDYRATTPNSAGEMCLASELGWNRADIRGDLAELLSGQAQRPDYQRHAFFRSIGLGLEDVALAHALYQLKQEAC
ncbi:ornithine cyclodeaminase family protein [Pseudomonas anguilliseptica]|uniref:ornithine cyclodeaminase family protein n=1 Tax=Pseudomonas anguilliseptica TaxID=53406 RepID=UPI001F194EF1|nr:ornithine cyclodeaminase family protein [Pseudomonas anguilliseptica]MCE5362478.1 ornithine cyclodeaminase family protein [Pseudomonas anguilliseptica]